MIQIVLNGLMEFVKNVPSAPSLDLVENVNQLTYYARPMTTEMDLASLAIQPSNCKMENALKTKDLPLKILSVASFKMEYV